MSFREEPTFFKVITVLAIQVAEGTPGFYKHLKIPGSPSHGDIPLAMVIDLLNIGKSDGTLFQAVYIEIILLRVRIQDQPHGGPIRAVKIEFGFEAGFKNGTDLIQIRLW